MNIFSRKPRYTRADQESLKKKLLQSGLIEGRVLQLTPAEFAAYRDVVYCPVVKLYFFILKEE